jgi:predicted nucleotidyltransferase
MAFGLKGENRIEEFRRIAKKLASKISDYKGVAGIAFIGGLVRGFADSNSDLDIVVLLTKRDEGLRKQLNGLASNEAKRHRVDLDMEVHFLEDFRKRKWDEIDRWEFAKAETVFDPEGAFKTLLREKLQLHKSFLTRRIVVCAEYLKWYCCPPHENVGTVAESWMERGDMQSAHYCLNYCVDLMLKILFALNKEHLPAPKWRLFYSHKLKWLPKDYSNLIGDAMKMRSYSRKDFNIRLQALRNMWNSTQPKIRAETGLNVDQISRYYVKKILRV